MPTILQLVGLVILNLVAYVIHPVLGLAVTGLFLLGVGIILDRPIKNAQKP